LYKKEPANFAKTLVWLNGSENARGPHMPIQWKLPMMPSVNAAKKIVANFI